MEAMDSFVHLHVHSHYSLLDGANRIDDLLRTAVGHGMTSLALTDHGNLYGAADFYRAAKKAGVKPILGIEAYISPTTRQDRSMGNQQTACYHLLLLAMNQAGWRNLLKLSSRAFMEGFYYKPRVDRELLAECNEGLLCSTACLGGEVPQALLAGDYDKARRLAGEYKDIFGAERFFIEVQNQGLPEQDRVNPELIRLAGELGVGVVGTNDVHFLTRDDKKAHEVLTCISTGKTLHSEGRLKYTEEVYLKSPEEMRQALAAWPAAADSTLRTAERCDGELDFSTEPLPVFRTPDGSDDDAYLRRLAFDGLGRRFQGREVPAEYTERLERELQVIKDKGYSSYFLIVNDFVQHARRRSIPAAPRGSGVATLLGYSLGVADVDPLRYGLLFERFTDPERAEAPDIDIDICQEGRGEIIRYVREKYGHVAQIITYGTLKARAVIRDVGRVLDVPLPEVDAVCKLVPEGPKVTLQSALSGEPQLQRLYESNEQVREIIDYGLRLEGMNRHAGVHAAGVIVCDEPLETFLPLCKQADSEDAITQWDGKMCELAGAMKMDFLGLRTLTIIQRARELVAGRSGKDLDPEALPLDDADVYALFRRGETDGVFQFESDGMKNVLLQMQPTRIEDLIAANALYRPGPMELIPSYCARKAGREPVPSVHELVDDLLAETYGIMAYQEQVMQVLNRLGKLPLNRALTLIKAISKKKEATIAAERPNFLRGAVENGISEGQADELFELILKFAGYGFNKAHSTRYAIVAYQSAYFKVHHPAEFLAATLTFECGDTDKVVQYMAEAARMGISIGAPDINTCGRDFTVVDDRTVRFGLAAVKGVGHKAVDAILAAREEGAFKDLFDFCNRVDLRAVNRATTEALIKCGAFDAHGATRAQMSAALDSAIAAGQSAAEDRRTGQMSMFGMLGGEQDTRPVFPKVEAWSESELLQAEKETLGFYVSSHPLVSFGRELESLSSPPGVGLARLEQSGDGTPCVIGCMIAQVRNTYTRKSNRKMAMLTLEDLTGKADAVVFPDTYEQVSDLLKPENLVFVVGSIDRQRERPSIKIDRVIPIDEAVAQFTASVLIRLGGRGKDAALVERLQSVLAAHRGATELQIETIPVGRPEVRVVIRAGDAFRVKPSRKLIDELVELLGDQNLLVLRPKPPAPGGNGRNGRWRGRKDLPVRSRYSESGEASAAVTRFD